MDGVEVVVDRDTRHAHRVGHILHRTPKGERTALVQQADCALLVLPGQVRQATAEISLHTLDEAQIPGIVTKLAADGLPNLFIPSRANFIKVEALPVLGTGKMDLRGLKRIAMERLLGDVKRLS